MKTEIFGFVIAKVAEGTKQFGEYGQEIAYTLTGKRGAVNCLVRYGSSNRMYVVNSKGNICGLKGN